MNKIYYKQNIKDIEKKTRKDFPVKQVPNKKKRTSVLEKIFNILFIK